MGPGPVSPALLDTATLVWPGAGRVRVARTGCPPPGTRDYVVLPGVSSPRWLLPADAPHAAAALEGQGSGTVRRLAASALALAHRVGLVRRLPVRRLRVEGGDAHSLVGAVRAVLGQDVEVAVRLAAWEHARGVVVRAFDPAGVTLAFGRMGIDDHGRAAVHAEQNGLARAAALDLRTIVIPPRLGQLEWEGRDVLLLAPLAPVGAQPPTSVVPIVAMMELASAGDARTGCLTSSGWWHDVRERITRVGPGTARDALEEALSALRSRGAASVVLGAWHGDWTPWNMAWDGTRVLLWDWEHFAEDVPVGFDPLHHLAQHARVTQGTDAAVQRAWRSRAHALLRERVGLDPAQADLVLLAYLLEVNLRYVLDRQGTTSSGTARDGWGLDLLRDEVRRADAG